MIYHIRGIFGGGFNFAGLANHLNIAKLNGRHLGYKHEFLSTQYSKPPIKNLVNCIFRANRQIFNSPIIPRIRYTAPKHAQDMQEAMAEKSQIMCSSLKLSVYCIYTSSLSHEQCVL